MKEIVQTHQFDKWLSKLKDNKARAIISAKILRLAEDQPVDIKTVGDGVKEIRIHYGPGYRVYYKIRGSVIIIILAGGTKTTQARDIKKAKELANAY